MTYLDISLNFKWNDNDFKIAQKILEFGETSEVIKFFAANCDELTDHSYWFLLSMLWVSHTDLSDLKLWKKLFKSNRPKRKISIMSLSEVRSFNYLPCVIPIYRVHKENEKDWISYTLDKNIAFMFAKERGIDNIKEYKVNKKDVLAIFLRHGKYEAIVIDKEKVNFIREINIGEWKWVKM